MFLTTFFFLFHFQNDNLHQQFIRYLPKLPSQKKERKKEKGAKQKRKIRNEELSSFNAKM